MTTIQKVKWIVGIIVAIITGILVPIYIANRNAEKTKIPAGKIMIEQRAIFPGGGSGTNYTIEKSIRVRKNTN